MDHENDLALFRADVRNVRAHIVSEALRAGARVISVLGTHPGAGASTLCAELARDADGTHGVVALTDGTRDSVGAWTERIREARSKAGLVLLDVDEYGGPDATAALLAAEAAVIVAQAGRSRWEQIEALVSRLEQLHVPVLGVVLNQRRYPIPRFLYDRL